MTGIGESSIWLILSQWAPSVKVVYKEVAKTNQVYTRSVFVDDERKWVSKAVTMSSLSNSRHSQGKVVKTVQFDDKIYHNALHFNCN